MPSTFAVTAKGTEVHSELEDDVVAGPIAHASAEQIGALASHAGPDGAVIGEQSSQNFARVTSCHHTGEARAGGQHASRACRKACQGQQLVMITICKCWSRAHG